MEDRMSGCYGCSAGRCVALVFGADGMVEDHCNVTGAFGPDYGHEWRDPCWISTVPTCKRVACPNHYDGHNRCGFVEQRCGKSGYFAWCMVNGNTGMYDVFYAFPLAMRNYDRNDTQRNDELQKNSGGSDSANRCGSNNMYIATFPVPVFGRIMQRSRTQPVQFDLHLFAWYKFCFAAYP